MTEINIEKLNGRILAIEVLLHRLTVAHLQQLVNSQSEKDSILADYAQHRRDLSDVAYQSGYTRLSKVLDSAYLNSSTMSPL